MSNLMKGKVFGLSLPNKKTAMAPHLHNVIPKAMEKSKMNKPSIFGAEESSDSDDGGDWVKKAMMTKKETKKEGDSSEEEVQEVKGQAEDDSKKAKTYADMLEEDEIRSPVRPDIVSLMHNNIAKNNVQPF